MEHPPLKLASLRLSRLEKSRLLLALLVSVAVHLGAWGGYELEKKFGLWSKLTWPVLRLIPKLPAQPDVSKPPPMIFLDVAEPDAEAPKQAKFYSANNSRAANPDDTPETGQVKLDGKQTEVVRTEDVPKPVKAQPTPPPKPTEPKPAQPNPANTLMPGGTEKAQPDKPAAPDRPRKLSEALAVQPKQLSGQQVKQTGGVQRRAMKASLDAISTPLGDYDSNLIAAVQSRWFVLLDKQRFAYDRIGRVTVEFRLNVDGTVTELKVVDSSVGVLLGYVCQQAIAEAAPFGAWPADLRRIVGETHLKRTFTFIYYAE